MQQQPADERLKRQAIQIATQFPDNRQDALRVLDYVRELLDWEMPAPVESPLSLVRPAG